MLFGAILPTFNNRSRTTFREYSQLGLAFKQHRCIRFRSWRQGKLARERRLPNHFVFLQPGTHARNSFVILRPWLHLNSQISNSAMQTVSATKMTISLSTVMFQSFVDKKAHLFCEAAVPPHRFIQDSTKLFRLKPHRDFARAIFLQRSSGDAVSSDLAFINQCHRDAAKSKKTINSPNQLRRRKYVRYLACARW